MADLTIKRNDIPLTTTFQLLYNDGTAINLTTASTINMFMRLSGSVSFQTFSLAITDAVNGKVSLTWASGDLQTSGTYIAEIQISFTGGFKLTCPSQDYITILIIDDIDDA